MRFDILSIFPEAFRSYFGTSILARAQAKGYIKINFYNIRDYTHDKHKTVDDRPYGGGAGMVMKADVVLNTIRALKIAKLILPVTRQNQQKRKSRILLMTPQGRPFTQKDARRLSNYERIVCISGRYEGYDERIRSMVDEELSLGDFVLSGGELPAMAVIDAVSRCVPGVLGKEESLDWESFSEMNIDNTRSRSKQRQDSKSVLLEYPQYTRPNVLKIGRKSLAVPAVLKKGDHAKILEWRAKQALIRTKKRRPDLLAGRKKS